VPHIVVLPADEVLLAGSAKVLQSFSRVLKRGLVTTGSRGHAQWVFSTSSTLSTLFLTSFTLYIADWREQGSSGGTVDDAQSHNLEALSPHISYTLNSAAQIAISTISSVTSDFILASMWHRQIKENSWYLNSATSDKTRVQLGLMMNLTWRIGVMLVVTGTMGDDQMSASALRNRYGNHSCPFAPAK